MGILEKILRKIIRIFLPIDERKRDSTYKLSFFKGAKLIEIKKTTKTINIDLSKTSKHQIDQLGRVYPDLIEDGVLILKDKDYNICKEYIEKSKDVPILKFFKGKLDDEDFEALRASVFIRNSRDKGENINILLEQLRKKFGSRGNNICNLYGEGYFDSVIKPLYGLLKGKKREKEFKDHFSEFVTALPISYFVSYDKSQKKVERELKEKILRNKKYGVKALNVHGIGKENKEKIEKFEKILKEKGLKTERTKEDDIRLSIKIYIE